MSAVERIQSGIPDLDKALDNIRLGDNVVWQVSRLKDFQIFALPFVKQAIADGRNLIYIRFAAHEPLIDPALGVKTYQIDLSRKFETFTVEVHKIIEQEGFDAFYVFDCLSEIQVAWSTDLMMSNFFRVTCPYLFQLDTVAYFPIIRGKHSFEAIAKIRDTTQLFLDIYSKDELVYLHPLKVWNRYSGAMFLPHRVNCETKEVRTLTDGISISKFYSLLNESDSLNEELNTDSLHRDIQKLKAKYNEEGLNEKEVAYLCDVLMSRNSRICKLIQQYFTGEDFFAVRSRTIGSGLIGGKACGMLIARKIIETDAPDAAVFMEPHDSFYIGSDVFYTYIVENNCWSLRIRQRTKQEYLSVSAEFQEGLKKGTFPLDIREQFRHMLDYYGQSPIIVRSSSILEDGFGNAFAGKYESVFCPNQGNMEERLNAFEEAVRTVYASTMNPSALEYRISRGLQERDEQMAILVQRVSGSRYQQYYMPSVAGVGYSRYSYKWLPDMDSNAGMLRLVGGLGTRAVDRTEGDYPRLVSLDRPLSTIFSEVEMRHRFSQQYYDVIDIEKSEFRTFPLRDVLNWLPNYDKRAVLEHDTEAERLFSERGNYRDVYFVSCQGITRNEVLIHTMTEILKKLDEAYQYPVDIEFTINLGENNTFVYNLLQCRPLQMCKTGETVVIPEIDDKNVLVDMKGTSMGSSKIEYESAVIYVEPQRYYEAPYHRKPNVARAIHEINVYFKELRKKNSDSVQGILLMVPGRIGTSSPELGVAVTFADINGFTSICEIAYSKAGYHPELSYGSHMFQDFVEENLYYGAIYESEKTRIYQPELLVGREDIFSKICPQYPDENGMIHVYEMHKGECIMYHDMESERTVIKVV